MQVNRSGKVVMLFLLEMILMGVCRIIACKGCVDAAADLLDKAIQEAIVYEDVYIHTTCELDSV